MNTCLSELSTIRPSLTKKAVKNREVSNVHLDDLATDTHHHPLYNEATAEESPHSSPSQGFLKTGCHYSTSLHGGTDVADKVVETLVITESESGTIIGQQGTTVNELEKRSGALISVTHRRGYKEGKVVVKGTVYQVRKAMEMIKKIVGSTVMARMTFSSKLNVRGAFLGEKGCKIRELERSTNTVIGISDSVSGRHGVGGKVFCGQITV